MENGAKSLVYSKNVVEFVTVANEYCGFLENAPDFSKTDFVNKSLKIISLLYLKSSMLLSIEPETDDEVETFVTEFDWNLIKNGIAAVIGENDPYFENYDDQLNETPEPVLCSISENLADTYQYLKDFIEIYKLGNEDVSLAALKICTDGFDRDWGYKLVSAMKILHILKYLTEDNNSAENSIKRPVTDKDNWFISKAQQNYKKNG